ncbi:PAS domain S-box protein [Sphingomonas panacisoli]|uniref:histidine kinase n=1 Tax=Sphingomonas panacisoli TaxID=1813879 RepID=A0A5B8LGQ7_9SPHN|nr:PAS domain-containing protein [Sphingomonas panacisoli]QDZ06844.1 PAS domain S-box protein [Sphingomonas panacisoli]
MTDVAPPSVESNHNAAAFDAIASLVVCQATTFVGLCDADFQPVFLNAAGRKLVGVSADADITNHTILDFFTSEHRPIVEAVVLSTLLREGHWEWELAFRHFTDPSRETEVRWSAFTLKDAADKLVGVAAYVSRDTSERRAIEEAVAKNEARLRAASDLVGLAIYSWDPRSGALNWDDRLRAMWGLPSDAAVDLAVYEAGIHPDDLLRVQRAIAACVDPAGDGRYTIEYRVIGRDDGVTRTIATSGQATFVDGQAVGFIGAAIDVTAQRRTEAAVRASEAQFRSFAAHSSNLIWIGDPADGTIIYRSAAYERIWGVPCGEAPTALAEWMKDVHPDDRQQVEHALASAQAGEVAQVEYRIIRPGDGAVRWLRDTSFPIPDDNGAVARIGGITEDLTQADVRQVYIFSARVAEGRRLAGLVRGLGYRARMFEIGAAFLEVAPVLAPGCVLVDLRKSRSEGLAIPRELKARSVTLPVIALDAPSADVTAAVAAMKAGAVDYVIVKDEASLRAKLAKTIAESHGAVRPTTRDENADARVARLTPRERDVLVGLIEGGTNKSIAQKLGLSPRTVELHRAQVMNRLNASSLTEMLRVALAAGIAPSIGTDHKQR